MKLKNKFYVAASRIQDGMCGESWRKTTLADAVEHAQTLMESDNTNEKYIVKVVAVVRKQKPPVSVIKVE